MLRPASGARSDRADSAGLGALEPAIRFTKCFGSVPGGSRSAGPGASLRCSYQPKHNPVPFTLRAKARVYGARTSPSMVRSPCHAHTFRVPGAEARGQGASLRCSYQPAGQLPSPLLSSSLVRIARGIEIRFAGACVVRRRPPSIAREWVGRGGPPGRCGCPGSGKCSTYASATGMPGGSR